MLHLPSQYRRQPQQIRERSGERIGPKRVEWVEGKLRMLRDQIAVRPLPVILSKIVIAERKGNFRGEVIAVGPGRYPNVHTKGKRDGKDWAKVRPSKAFRPTEVKVGDIVELGSVERDKDYAFTRILLNGEEIFIATEQDVAGIEERCE